METEFNVEVSESELAYRSKHYHDIRAIRQRELSCASCGNVLSHDTEQCFSHPVFGILQCRKCNDKTVEAFKSQNRRFCHICIQRKYSFRCDNKDCVHKFCETCIKRNAAQSLEKAKTDDWECLACNTKPLWKLRAACAAVMSSDPKRTKTKKVSRNRSSDREKSSDLTKISYVRRCTLNQTKKLSQRLETLCDDEESNGTPDHTEFRPDRYQSKVKEGQGNATTNMGKKVEIGYAKSRFATCVESSDDSEVETVQQRIKKRKISITKSRREQSPELGRKNNSSDVKKNNKNAKVSIDSVSMNSRKSSISNLGSSSDEADIEEVKRSKSSKFHKSKSKNEDISESKRRVRDDSSNEDSEDEKKRSRNKKKHNSSSNVTKRDKFEKSRNDKSPKGARTKVTDDEDSDRVKFKEKRGSSKNTNSRMSRESLKWQATRRPNAQKSTRDSSPEENSDRDKDVREKMSKTQRSRVDKKIRQSRNDKEAAGGKSRKSSLDHQRIKDLSLPPSDSSSGKEFQNTKIVQKSFVPLGRLSELNEDYTKPPQECEDDEEDVLPKEQTFALKNTVNHFVTEMRVAVKKLLNDIETAQTSYRMKDSMHVKDADRMVLEATKAVANLKEYVERGENKMTDYYDRWCKKTKVRNVLKSKRRSSLDKERSSSTKNSPNKSDKKSKEVEDDESIPSEKTPSSQRRSDKSRIEKSAKPIVEGSVVVSDCDSDIFSNEETEKTTKKSNKSSQSKIKRKVKSRVIDEDKEESEKESLVENGEFVENENDESPTVEKNRPTVSSSSDESDRAEAMNSRKSSKSNNRKTSRESIDPSDTDMFETTPDKIQDSEPEISEENDKTARVEISKESTKRASTDEESPESTLTPHSPSKSPHDTKIQNAVESLDIAGENTEIPEDINSKEISPDRETTIDESLHNTNNQQSNHLPLPQTIDGEASTEKEQSADESVHNFDADVTNEKYSSSSETEKNDENVTNPDSLHVERELDEVTTQERSPEKRSSSPENENITGEKRTSLDIRDSGENEKIHSEDSNTEPAAAINDSETLFSPDASLSENENKVENTLRKSPNMDDSVRGSSVDTEIVDILNKTKERSASRSRSGSSMSSDVSESENIRKREELLASSDSVHDKTKDRSTSKSRSSNVSRTSTTSDVSESENIRKREELLASSDSVHDKTKDRSTSKSRSSNVSRTSTTSDVSESENLRKREELLASSDSILDTTKDRSASRSRSSNVSRSSMSSNISEGENNRRRAELLASSDSDDSDAGNSLLPLQNSGAQDGNEETPPTPPESDSNSSKNNDNNLRETERSATERNRTKRHKFRIQKNKYYINDKRLKQECVVRLKRLKKSILVRHARALNKSRDYVESKKLKRLVALDDLEKDKKVTENSDSENENSDSSKNLKKKKKRGREASKEPEETLMDHLNKVDNGDNNSLSEGSDSDSKKRDKDGKGKKDEFNQKDLLGEANRMAKERLLESSDSAEEVTVVPDPQDEDSDNKEKKSKSKKVTKEKKKKNSEKSSDDDEKKQEKSDKGRWRKNKLLTMTISDSDSGEDKKKFDLSQEKMSAKKKNAGSSDSEQEKLPKKKRVRRRVLHSDSDVEVSPLSDSDSSDDSIKKKKKKKKKGSSDDDAKKEAKKKTRKRIRRGERSSDSSDSTGKRVKTRRKRIKTADSDSDSDNSQGSPGKSGRKNIRKVIRDKQVANDTKQAAKDEEERLQRIAERQKLYNQMYETRLAGETKVDKLVLDFDEETKEPLVSVDEELVKRLKPHQAQGIKFMWDACFESLERTKSTKGSGCILAHCMGLGKTFQIVSLSHTLLQHKETGIKTIMVVCPLSTVLNWVNEFKIWLENLDDGDDIEVYELTKLKKNFERKYLLQRWQETGGVMILGYEMFRNLSSGGKKVRKNIQETFMRCLVDPGADLVVCDEGHLLKNEDTALSKAMRRVKTLRRIVLTGTPLQNNLIEYHCMVQFVKPNLLGTKKEFMNRFENPITNGQFDDSTEYDVKLMKKRAHVLHKMLEGSVQRLDYSVLTPFLPPKQEYVIFVKLTEVQIKLYRHYLDNYARRHRGVGGSLFADFQALQRIWTHPMVMQMNAEKVERANEKKRMDATDSEGSLRDFIDDGSDSDSSNSSDVRSVNGSDGEATNVPKRGTRANPVRAESPLPVVDKTEESNFAEIEWWTQFVKEDDYEDMRISSKLLILFRILKESEQMGDKLLVFSQSLYSLSLIEKFLAMIDEETQNGNEPEKLDKHTGSWSIGLDYFRLDGQSTTDNRRRWCDIFNKPSNTRARLFLISTRAGGLGINLTAANRVVIFDASWNPSHDVQSIFRIYRFGQKKPCYVYRLLAAGTMEEKIYNRQVTKLSLSCRVVDEQQIERHYSNNALAELYKLEISETEQTLNLPKDRMLAEIFLQYKHCVETYHEHDSLLENQAGEELDEEERQQAWLEYEEEKKGKRMMPQMPFVNTYQNEILMQQMLNMGQQNNLPNPAMMNDYQQLQHLMSKDYPGLPEAQQKLLASRAVYEMYNYVERQTMANHNPMGMMNMAGGQMGFGQTSSHPTPDMVRLYQQSLMRQQNDNVNYPINQGMMGDVFGQIRNKPVVQMAPQIPVQSSTSSSVLDDDIVEIPSSPERNSAPPSTAPGVGRKSQEE